MQPAGILHTNQPLQAFTSFRSKGKKGKKEKVAHLQYWSAALYNLGSGS